MTRRRRRRGLVAASGIGRDPGGRASAPWKDRGRRVVATRASEVTQHARRAGEEADVGKHGAKGPLIEVSTWTRSARIGRALGASAPVVERGVAAVPKLEVRRQAKLHPWFVGRRSRRARARGGLCRRIGANRKVASSKESAAGRGARSGIGRQTECSCRASVAEVGETHLSRGEARLGATRVERSGGMARGDPPAFDEAGAGSRRAKGCEGATRT